MAQTDFDPAVIDSPDYDPLGIGPEPSPTPAPEPKVVEDSPILADRRKLVADAALSDATPENAARAIKLSRTNRLSPAVNAVDVDGYAREEKYKFTTQILDNNEYLREYIRRNPMAKDLSSGDWDKLDEITEIGDKLYDPQKLRDQVFSPDSLLTLPRRAITAGLAGAYHGAIEGLGEGVLGSWVNTVPQLKDQPELTKAAWGILGGVPEVMLRGLGGLMHGTLQGALGALTEGAKSMPDLPEAVRDTAGWPKMAPEKFAREVTGVMEMLLNGVGPHGVHIAPQSIRAAHRVLENTEHFLNTGKQLPGRSDPVINKFQEQLHDIHQEYIEDMRKKIVASPTYQHDPVHMRDLLRVQREGMIEISGEAVAKLYGDEIPHPEDGKLGFEPSMVAQLEQARQVGGDVTVKWADFMALVDDATFAAIKEHVKVTPGEITKAEREVREEQAKVREEALPPPIPEEASAPPPEPTIRYYHGTSYENAKDFTGSTFVTPHEQYARDYRRGEGEGPNNLLYVDLTKEQAIARGLWDEVNDYARHGPIEDGAAVLKPVEKGSAATPPGTEVPVTPAVATKNLGYRGEKVYIAEPLPEAKGSSGLEPMFAQGDRKLTLEKKKREAREYDEPGANQPHDFAMLNEHGQEVGYVNLTEKAGGKDLYVDMISGLAGFDLPFTFGNALTRDLVRQLKREFPEAERIGGHRVSGARWEAKQVGELVWINLNEAIRDPGKFQEFISQAGEYPGIDIGYGSTIRYAPELTPKIAKLEQLIRDDLARIIGKDVKVFTPNKYDLTPKGNERFGEYRRFTEQNPWIVIALEHADALGIARHEAVHHLRMMGFIRPGEWEMLARASRDGEWVKNYEIDTRYEKLSNEGKLEESVAEAYRAWFDGDLRMVGKYDSKAEGVFQRLKEFFSGLLQKARSIVGNEAATWESMFQKIESGEVKDRKPGEKENPETMFEPQFAQAPRKPGPKARAKAAEKALGEATAEAEVTPPVDKGLGLFATPGTIGLTADQARGYKNQLKKVDDDAKARGLSEAEEIRSDMTAEQVHKEKAILSEIDTKVRERPTVAADLLLANGEYYGNRLAERPKIGWDELTPEQRAVLPESYYGKKGEITEYTIDDVGSMVGYRTGKEMVADLVEFNKAKAVDGDTAKTFVNKIVDAEVKRVMAAEGDLGKNIQDRINDHLASRAYQDLISQETLLLGVKAGMEAPINKTEFRAAVKELFEELPVEGVKTEGYKRATEKLQEKTKTEMLLDKWEEAFKTQQAKEKQHQLVVNGIELDRQKEDFAKTTKKLAARDVKGLDQVYQDVIQTMLHQAGLPVRRSLDEIRRSQEHTGMKGFETWLTEIEGDGWRPDVSEGIRAGDLKRVEDMSVGEWREFKNAVDSLDKIGRWEEWNNAFGKRVSFMEFKGEVLRNINSLPLRNIKGMESGALHQLFRADAELTRMEVMLKALDLGQDMGPMVNAIIRPMAEAKHKEYTMEEKLSKDIKAIGMPKEWSKSLKEHLPNDWFMDPRIEGGATPMEITRSNLINIMLNWGNKSNRRKMSESWGSSELGVRASKAEAAAFDQRMSEFIREHATADDVKYVQSIWNIYKGFRKDMDDIWRNTSGTQPRMVESLAFDTKHGTLEGGYYPLIRDRVMSDKPAAQIAGTLFGENYPSYATPQGYTKDRTSAAYYVNFRGALGDITMRMQQVIHDIAFRAEVMQARQVLKDPQIRYAINNHYGPEYLAQMDPWLQRTANGATLDETALAFRDSVLRKMRMNLTNYALPLNYVVMFTPDLGLVAPIIPFYKDRAGNMEIANKWSKEIPHAIYNIDRDFREASHRLVGEGKIDTYKAQAVRWGFAAVTKASREFRTATFIKYYNEGRAKGLDESHAAAIADTYVREQHASAALHDLPAIMASGEAGRAMTMFYGYWNTQYNWLKTTKGKISRGEYMDAAATVWGSVIVGSIFGAMIANSAKEEDTAVYRALKSVPMQLGGMLPYGVRELVMYSFEDITPRTPLSSALQAGGSALKDLKNWKEGIQVEKGIRHAAGVGGLLLGIPGALQLGRTGQGLYDWALHRQQPRNFLEWQRLILTGEAKLKSAGER